MLVYSTLLTRNDHQRAARSSCSVRPGSSPATATTLCRPRAPDRRLRAPFLTPSTSASSATSSVLAAPSAGGAARAMATPSGLNSLIADFLAEGFAVMVMSVEVPLWSDQECRQDYGDQAIKDSMLCAGDTGKAGNISSRDIFYGKLPLFPISIPPLSL